MSDDTFEQLYTRLNDAQKRAVDTIEGPVLVVAGPGSGKTEILSLRVANILNKTDIYASNILCLTFTDSAAVNMRERLSEIIGTEAYHVAIHTFHNFCVDVKNQYPEYFHDGATFNTADELVQTEILEEIFADLPHDNPIQSTHPDHGFVYLSYAKQSISDLKKAGLTPEEFIEVLDHNEAVIGEIEEEIDRIFSQRVSKEILKDIEKCIEKLTQLDIGKLPVPHIRPLSEILALSLERARDTATDEDSTTPITEWKKEHTRKVDDRRILKAAYYLPKMRALAEVYDAYTKEMYRQGYYDFDDMLLDVIHVLEDNGSLKAELQEQFQYILVDEFQDTNEAQMRLLDVLADNPMHPERPNVMAVGDDDQAIYKFQGAEISNILNFKHAFPDPEVVTMTTNYRSTQDVLDMARSVITQGEERLEAMMADMDKELTAGRDGLDGKIAHFEYPTRIHEYYGVAQKIKEEIAEGTDPDEIAVIGRYHSDLEELVPYLHEEEIPIAYERQQDVLSEPHIRQLITMARFIHSLAKKDRAEADEYLPEILSFPFWEIERKTIWKISLAADRKRELWLEVMLEHEDEYIQDIAEFFLDVAAQAKHDPVEYVLDTLVGADMLDMAEKTADDIHQDEKGKEGFVSPYKQHYFGKERFEENKTEYLTFLSSLKCFIRAVREYKEGRVLGLDDLIDFVDMHEDNNLLVTDTSPFVNAETALELMTAHKAKGREFDTVFILSSQQDTWVGGRRRKLLPFPENLPIAPAGDTYDDKLRLFYVALTRAKHNLYIYSHAYDEDGDKTLPVQFITDYDFDMEKSYDRDAVPDVDTLLETTVPEYHKPPFVKDETALLTPLVEDYQLSVTHFNNFLDVTRGGPQAFLEQNLLRFPQPMAVPAVYGSVIHETLRWLYTDLKKNETLPPVDAVLEYFENELSTRRLSDRDFEHFCERGIDALKTFYESRKDTFSPEHIIEFNFRRQGVAVDDVPITGKIDKMVPDSAGEMRTMRVHDFKTGKAMKKWQKSSTKLWRYKNQLLFYKLLVEHSREFGEGWEVNTGVLEFVEPVDDEIVTLSLDIAEGDIVRVRKLISAVYDKITNLDFPDVDDYAKKQSGIREFEDDLLQKE